MAGVCQAGDALGLIDGDVAVIGGDLVETGTVVLDRMLAAGGEMVTLVLGAGAPTDLADRLERPRPRRPPRGRHRRLRRRPARLPAAHRRGVDGAPAPAAARGRLHAAAQAVVRQDGR